MGQRYKEYNGLDLPNVANDIQQFWKEHGIFQKSLDTRADKPRFVFYEGPPSANGLPGIHHVMGRTIKDIFCRYKTLSGFLVERKAGWDTHGLPVELKVEKELGITKEDIGKTISIEEYNVACKNAVMKYTGIWNTLTEMMGYWVDIENPYVTYDSKYMESVWWLIGNLFQKNLLFKGYTIQPYSPAAGTGLSTHEINQPGCYKDVKDTSIVAQFEWKADQSGPFHASERKRFFLAWTTTPWTLPSNTALTVGPKIRYALVETLNPYTKEHIEVVLAESLIKSIFGSGFVEVLGDITSGDIDGSLIPFKALNTCLGSELIGLAYHQLLPYCQPAEHPERAFFVIGGDFVTTEDGTGIVHTAPTFGADDARVASEHHIPAMLIKDEWDQLVPLVDLKGRFRPELGELGGKYVKNEYYPEGLAPDKSVDVEIAILLKTRGMAFKVEKYEHNYPHCWRTDKPILYYPLDSWFIRVSEHRSLLVNLNNNIHWKPESTGTGRFGKWLESANDWNLSRSRFWGIPLPIWSSEDGLERLCISSISELKSECQRSVQAGFLSENPLKDFIDGDMSLNNYNGVDLHKNFVDDMVLVSPSGKAMKRESDLIDVWFDSGSMPYAQWHYPFENKEKIDGGESFPADFIAEGVDQTRGWFYTLHVIAGLVFGKPAYKNVLSNGLVQDKTGQKMSKRLGNVIDPFETIGRYGPDATRWYMITNSQPWDNIKFDSEGIKEVQRKFFGTLYNTYSFFAIYANIDQFDFSEPDIPIHERPEMDRWIISKLYSLVEAVGQSYDEFDATMAGRLIQEFVADNLSNWYVRLCRRRFWKNDKPLDKTCAYQTLYTCLETVAILGSPIAPFYMDRLFQDLNQVSIKHAVNSVHLVEFPKPSLVHIDKALEQQMELAQKISSLGLSLRKKEKIRVRQPLRRILLPSRGAGFSDQIRGIEGLIKLELNIKSIEIIDENNPVLVKQIKPNFKTIGPKFGKYMKEIAVEVAKFGALEIQKIEKEGRYILTLSGEQLVLESTDFEIAAKDLPGWSVATDGGLTVALDINIDSELWKEGIARELVNRIQNGRKNKGFELTDRISIELFCSAAIKEAAQSYDTYIIEEVLSDGLIFLTQKPTEGEEEEIEKDEQVVITIKKTQDNGMVI